jgi:tetratricopeptide (TPR) repeat protein
MLAWWMKARTHRTSRFAVAAALVVSGAQGQGGTAPPAGPAGGTTHTETSPDAAARAKQHFQRGRELYSQGAYREAITELEAAHKLDPTAKDLVYNLSIVNEKLGQIDEALHYLHAYLEMDLEAPERTRAEAAVKRLEGSKKEVVVPFVAPVPTPPRVASTGTPEKPPPTSQPHGRVDAATVTFAATSVAGLAVGAIFGIKALSDQPSGLVSGKDGNTPTSIEALQQHAHTEGIVADVGFGVGVAALAVTAYLYFGRTKAAAPDKAGVSVPVVTAAAGGHGAVFVLGGKF